jgi:DNA recombination protein RmuC
MALLNVVAHGWRQQEMAENAERIGQAGKDLYDRLAKFVEHFSGIGDALSRAGKAFDAAVGSYQSRIQPAARRLAEQAAIPGEELPDVPPADGPTRMLGPADESKGVEG